MLAEVDFLYENKPQTNWAFPYGRGVPSIIDDCKKPEFKNQSGPFDLRGDRKDLFSETPNQW